MLPTAVEKWLQLCGGGILGTVLRLPDFTINEDKLVCPASTGKASY